MFSKRKNRIYLKEINEIVPEKIFEKKINGKTWHIHLFNNSREAEAYLSWVRTALPSHQEELLKACINKDYAGKFWFQLTSTQYRKFQNYLFKEKIKNSINDPDQLAENMARLFKTRGVLIKSIRYDNKCFIRNFIDGVTKSKTNQPEENLRKGQHKQYTVTKTGAYKRSEKPSPYLPLAPEKIKNKKQKRSAFQSTSLVTPEAQIPVFGHSRTRADKLAGVIMDPDDAMINRMYIYDGGTVRRPYEFDSYKEALNYYKNKKDTILFASMENFEKAIAQENDNYNEVLARIRWNKESSAIGIFSDTFEARCIAQLYARQMRDRLKAQYKELGKPWNESYQIPIIHYLPENPKNWQPYTQANQKEDVAFADSILNDKKLLKQAFANENFEFLLLVSNPRKILDLEINNIPILKYLFEKGEIQLVDSICYLTNLKQEELFEYLKEDSSVKLRILPSIDADDNTVLHLAAELNHSTLEFLLTDQTIDVNRANKEGETPLILALANNHDKAAKMLLNVVPPVDVNMADSIGNTALMWAASNGNVEIVKKLLKDSRIDNNAINAVHTSGNTALLFALKNGHTEVAKILLKDGRADVNIADSIGNTALMWAAKKGNIEIVKLLLDDSRIDNNSVNAVHKSGNTALLFAFKNGHNEIAKILLKDGRADVNIVDQKGLTTLMLSSSSGSIEVIKFLLDNPHFDKNLVNAVHANGKSALLIALRKGHTEVAKILLEDCRADVNIADSIGNTPLMWAASNGNVEMVKKLLKDSRIGNNAINAVHNSGNTALLFALKNGHTKVAKILLQDGRADVNIADSFGNTPLMWAARKGDTEIVKLLLEDSRINKNSLNESNESDDTALMWAASKGNTEIVKLLLEDSRIDNHSINAVQKSGNTALSMAIWNDHTEVIKKLLDDGRADVNIANSNGNTPLMWAARKGDTEIVKLLLEDSRINKNSLNKSNESDDTALIWAASNGNVEIVKLLLKDSRIDNHSINAVQKSGNTALSIAIWNDHTEVIKKLLDDGRADVNIANSNGNTVLISAASKGNTEIVKLLLDDPRINKNSLNAINESGNTALLRALKNGHTEVATILLNNKNIDVNITDDFGAFNELINMARGTLTGKAYDRNDGNTALMLAAKDGNSEIVRLLLENSSTKVNIANRNDETALLLAFKNGHIQVAKLLLDDKRVDVSATLNWAKNNKDEKISKLIIKMLLKSHDKKLEEKTQKISGLSFFGNWGSTYSIEDQRKAIKDLRQAQKEKKPITNKVSLEILQKVQDLAEITDAIPAETKKVLGLK